MNIGPRGFSIIKQFEGLHLKAYKCVAGFATIGYGHLIRKNEDYLLSEEITEVIADTLLKVDISVSERSVKRLISPALTRGQYDALVSFTFNLGGGSLQISTLRSMINRGDIIEAADQFPRWIWAGGRKWKGLILRRSKERLLFLDTNYETETIELPEGYNNG